MDQHCGFDPEDLLQPISDDTPCGADPRTDISAGSRYLRVKDARGAARRQERANDIDGGDSPIEDWRTVVQLSREILGYEGKDLEVAAWLIEGLVRLNGFAGLHAGLSVAEGLVSRYWDAVFPLPDEEGNEDRLAPFISLNGTDGNGALIQPLRKVPITGGDPPCALWHFQQATEISRLSDPAKRAARMDAGGHSLEAFDDAVRQTPASFYARLMDEARGSLDALNALSDAFSAHVGRDAPPAGDIRSALNDVIDAVKSFAGDKLVRASGEAEPSTEAVGSGKAAADASPGGRFDREAPTDREDALQQIQRLAAYFRAHEPHSPISYTLEETVRRARMSMRQLLDELIVDGDAHRYFYIASGLKPPEAES